MKYKRKNRSDTSARKETRRKRPKQRQKSAGRDNRILSFKDLLCTAFMAVCFGFPGITTAETWSVQNEFMVCVRLAAYTGAVVLAVLAVLSAYNRRKLLVIAGLVFGGVYLLGRLHIGESAAKIVHVISMADAVLCVAAGIIPAFIVYLILRLVSGRVADAVVYQVVRWILIVVAGFIFGNLLYRLFSGRRSDRRKRRKTKQRRKRRRNRKERDSGNNRKKKKLRDNQPDDKKKTGNDELSGRTEKTDENNKKVENQNHSELPSDSPKDNNDNDDDYYYDEELSAEEEEEKPDILGRIITRKDGCTGFIRNHNGKYAVLFEDGSTSEVRMRNGKYYYESRPGAWTLIK